MVASRAEPVGHFAIIRRGGDRNGVAVVPEPPTAWRTKSSLAAYTAVVELCRRAGDEIDEATW